MAFGTSGTSARDQAALAAMVAWIAANPDSFRPENVDLWKDQLAKAAYKLADALSSAS